MGNLKDELLKKGLTSDKRARQLAHEEKARKNVIGRQGVEEERRTAEDERLSKEKSRRESDRQRELQRQQEETARAAQFGLAQLITSNAVTQGMRGPRRFHFVTRDRKIPFFDLSDDVGKQLELGSLAICEVPRTDPEQFAVIPAETANRVRESAPELIRFQNQPGAGRTGER